MVLLFSSALLTPRLVGRAVPLFLPVYSSASSNCVSPHFSTKAIFIKVFSDLYAPKSHGHASVFMLCDLSVDFNKIDPSFFLRETMFSWYPSSHILLFIYFFLSPLWLYFSIPLPDFSFLLDLEMLELPWFSLRSFSFIILHSLLKSTHPLSWPHFYAESSQVCTTAQTLLQSQEPLKYLLCITA